MDDCGEEVVYAMDSNVDGEQEADEDLICKYNGCLHHMEAVACECRGRNRPACMRRALRLQQISMASLARNMLRIGSLLHASSQAVR